MAAGKRWQLRAVIGVLGLACGSRSQAPQTREQLLAAADFADEQAGHWACRPKGPREPRYLFRHARVCARAAPTGAAVDFDPSGRVIRVARAWPAVVSRQSWELLRDSTQQALDRLLNGAPRCPALPTRATGPAPWFGWRAAEFDLVLVADSLRLGPPDTRQFYRVWLQASTTRLLMCGPVRRSSAYPAHAAAGREASRAPLSTGCRGRIADRRIRSRGHSARS
jgi:hypothetical protein